MKRPIRIAVFAIAALNIAIWVYAKANSGPMPDAIGGDTFWPLVGMALAMVTVPALILAITGRFLTAALVLVLIPEIFLAGGWIMGAMP